MVVSVVIAIATTIIILSVVRTGIIPSQYKSKIEPQKNESTLIKNINDTFVWLGDGCFWEGQYIYVMLELDPIGLFKRDETTMSSLAGYAGSTQLGNDGLVCYELQGNNYEELGHSEVTQVKLDGGMEIDQFRVLVRHFFDSFIVKSDGFERPDPRDKGGAYRSVIGIPLGVKGTLFSVVQQENAPRGEFGLTMVLKEDDEGSVDDMYNTVFIMDSNVFPFYRGEQYHQIHSDVKGPRYPTSYNPDLWDKLVKLNRIPPTSCPEGNHW